MSKKNGRPLAIIDWETVDKLCALHCTGVEIASIIGVGYDTLESAIKREFKLSFPEYFAQKSATGKVSLRRKQYTAAVDDGVPSMMIWLGKQWLGQQDKPEPTAPDREPEEENATTDKEFTDSIMAMVNAANELRR